MPFRIRDLMVTVLPASLAQDCTANCSNQHSDCPGGCSNADSHFHTESCRKIDTDFFTEVQKVLNQSLVLAGCDAGISRDCPGGCSNSTTKFPNWTEWIERGDPPPDLVEMRRLLQDALIKLEAVSPGALPTKGIEIDSLERKLVDSVGVLRVKALDVSAKAKRSKKSVGTVAQKAKSKK